MAKNNKKENKSIEELLKEALVPEEEQPYKIPDNWVWVKFGIIGKLYNGYAFKSTDYNDIGIPLIRISEIDSGDIDLSKSVKIPMNLVKNDFLVQRDDLLIAMSGATTGKMGIYKNNGKALQNQRVGNIKIKYENLLIKKLRNYFFSKSKEDILKSAYGAAQPNISGSMIENLAFPLPPIQEQKRIVEKLESMLGKIKQAKDLIEEAKDTFKNRRASILAKAFSGELTKNWREENPNIESAEILLEKIKSNRFSNSKKILDLEDIYSYKEKENFGVLPNTWCLVTLEKVCESFKYGTSAKSNNEGLVPVIRMGNLQNGKIDWSDLVYSSDESEVKKYSLNKNDVLFNRTNSPELVGKTSIYKGEMPAIYAGYLIKIINYKELDSDFLNFFLNSHIAKEYCWKAKTDGVSQSNINAQKLAKFEIPLPPTEEQKEIVRIVENLLKIEDEALEKIESMEEHLELLEKSILSKAFRGELGTNDPEEESSITLLKEILSNPEPKKEQISLFN
ncbi:MAG: restriction endonuclease subunit S [Candidatus Sericytochromatia bacterium]